MDTRHLLDMDIGRRHEPEDGMDMDMKMNTDMNIVMDTDTYYVNNTDFVGELADRRQICHWRTFR
jgi:hypothetical protein